MRNYIDITGFVLGWFAIIGQFFLAIENRQTDVTEAVIRFFSYFTVLTNLLVVLYFTSRISIFQKTFIKWFSNNGTITALTSFILIVGLVYQIILRSAWHPTGLQKIIDELLHTVIPLFTLIYWAYFANSKDYKIKNIKIWFWYPIGYFLYIIIRGYFSNFYPYPFVDVTAIGYLQVIINSIIVTVTFLAVLSILIFIGKKFFNRESLS